MGTQRAKVTWGIACPRSHIRISCRARTKVLTPKFLFFSCSLIWLSRLSLCLSVHLFLDQQNSYGLHSVHTSPSKSRLKLLHGLALTTTWTRLGLAKALWAKGSGRGGRPGSWRESKAELCPRSMWGLLLLNSHSPPRPAPPIVPIQSDAQRNRAPKPLLTHTHTHAHILTHKEKDTDITAYT